DRLFLFAGLQWRKSDVDPEGPREDSTNTAPRGLFSLRYEPGRGDTFRALLEHDDIRLRHDGAVDEDVETTRVDSPTTAWSLVWSHLFGSRAAGDVKDTGWSGVIDRRPEVPANGRAVRLQERSRHQLNLGYTRFAERFGHHEFKFGLEIERSGADSRFHYLGGYAPISPTDTRDVVAYSYDVSARNRREGAFAQDAWRVRDRVVVSAGLRLDWHRGEGEFGPTVYDARVLQPRIGFAWTLDHAG